MLQQNQEVISPFKVKVASLPNKSLLDRLFILGGKSAGFYSGSIFDVAQPLDEEDVITIFETFQTLSVAMKIIQQICATVQYITEGNVRCDYPI